ncbi:hypothetical protein [Caballeronia sordidicola]|jgi:PadR family transcriptional regulator, regulatory protein PadR|uniref:hypothetical protein n=1 Tax=Caballeronia sordidicola TaxID=196367 RepID=UPI000691DB04|nr:hypothetical protein [Caballeronia sordidicola]
MDDRDLYADLIRLHVLHEEPVYSLVMIQALARHGYKMSRALSPISRGLEEAAAKQEVRELFGELFESK